jgi:phosphopantothenate synthetase
MIPDDVLACESIVQSLRNGDLRAARRGMLVTSRFGTRSRVEVAHLALEVAAAMIRSGSDPYISLRTVQAALKPEEPDPA